MNQVEMRGYYLNSNSGISALVYVLGWETTHTYNVSVKTHLESGY